MKKQYKTFNVDGALLSQSQLEEYMKKIASDHILTEKSQRKTFPVPRLKDNLNFIFEVYTALNEDLKNNLPIHPAGEWLLDNYYVIEKNAKIVMKDLTVKKYVNLLGIANGQNEGLARSFVIAKEIIAYTDGKISGDSIEAYLNAYQSKKTLSMDELWNIVTFLQISLIEKIRGICEKIYLSQMQKRKVEDIITRLVEMKSSKMRSNCGNIEDTSESKYPFIEYMSYRLKKYGKRAYEYQEILEEQTMKMGASVDECINREHFDMAAKKVSIGNSIGSMNLLNRLNYVEIFDRVNGVEEELKRDPANVYEKMDYETKEYYRSAIEKIAQKTKISEFYIARKCVELANIDKRNSHNVSEKSHVGYYLIDEGKKELLYAIGSKKIKSCKQNPKFIVYGNVAISLIVAILISVYVGLASKNVWLSIASFLLLWIILWSCFEYLIQYISGKIISPKLVPKLDFLGGVPKEHTTMVVIPTIVDSDKKVYEIFKKLEIYYMANKSKNLYFTLLGDCTSNVCSECEIDEQIISAGKSKVELLNQKHSSDDYPIFSFVYRRRTWSESEQCYLGWERKRGLLTQFNEYLLKQTRNMFLYSSFENCPRELPQIKYIITLDSDTNLSLNSGLSLVGAMAHILNRPRIDERTRTVTSGYGIIQPRVGINIDEAGKSNFARLFSGVSGVDSYTNAISDFYQDNYKEGIYTGKGIYDLQVFSEALKDEIPEEKVLSHDLLEGSYLKCGLATDIMLMDGYPATYLSYRKRAHRWIRGDYQILGWLKSKKINLLSKYKILDNIVRSMQARAALFLIVLACVSNSGGLFGVSIFSIFFQYILEGFNRIIGKRNGQLFQRKYNKQVTGYKSILLRAIVDFMILPDKAYMSYDAMSKAIFRMFVSKKKLLEWVTSEEADRKSEAGIFSYYMHMFSNVVAGIFMLILGKYFVGILWILGPAVMSYLSKKTRKEKLYEVLDEEEKAYINEMGYRTWQFFKTYLNEENNFLPPDNYQEDRKNKIVQRTSPTNIGLALLSVVASGDLKYESKDYVINIIERMVDSIEKLPKWNGHLYNWYNIATLKPLFPRYISSVDSGNFVGYLYVLKTFLEHECEELDRAQIGNLVGRVSAIINETDFSKLFDEKTGLFSIGFNIEENKMTESYYDLLASEARQTSIVAIAKRDVSAKHWKNLGRSLTILDGYKGLVSWSGTAFEYLMPTINIKRYEGSLLDESCKFMIMSQIEYAKKIGVVWGISESAFNLKDFKGNYQYKAFGIPWLGLKRGLADDIVVSSYGTVLAINDIPKETVQNLKNFEGLGMFDKFGMYESIDFTPSRARNKKKYAAVKTYMAHHQGLILLSINNLVNDKIFQERFFENPEIAGIDILLQERMPDNVIITKEKKEHVEKIKYANFDYYSERLIDKAKSTINECNVLSNNDYTILIDEDGMGYSKYKDKIINRYKRTDDEKQGVILYVKDVASGDVFIPAEESAKVVYNPDKCIFYFEKDGLKYELCVFIAPDESVEIRNLNIKNLSESCRELEVSSVFEPVMSTMAQDYAHKAFNKMFLKFEKDEKCIVAKRSFRGEEDLYMVVASYAEDGKEYEFGVDKEAICGRNNFGVPDAILNSDPMLCRADLTVNPIIATRRKVTIEAGEEQNVALIVGVSNEKEKAIAGVEKYFDLEQIVRAQKVSKAQAEAKIQYLGMNGKAINLYERILSHVYNVTHRSLVSSYGRYGTSELWKFGISGDNPIVLVKVSNVSEIDVVKSVIQAFEYYKLQNVGVDIVIENDEMESYENYLQNAINEVAWNVVNDEKSGVFILKSLSEEDKELLNFRASLVIPGKYGKIDYLLDELENESFEVRISKKPFEIAKDDNSTLVNMENCKFYNGYGGFSEEKCEYILNINKKKKLPAAWSNVLANEKFGTIVTENMGGYTWYKNSRLNRITAWCNDAVCDIPSEVLYISDIQKNTWWTPALLGNYDENEFYVKYGRGYAEYLHLCENIEQKVTVFVPQKNAAKIYLVELKNLVPERRTLRLTFYAKVALDEDDIKSDGFIKYEFDARKNIIKLKNLANTEFDYWMGISSSEKISSCTGSKNIFLGDGSIVNPAGVLEKDFGSPVNGLSDGIIAFNFCVEIDALEQKNFSICYGCADKESEVIELASKYTDVECCQKELSNSIKKWEGLTGMLTAKTPEKQVDLLVNDWILYQAYSSRMLAKSGYYQSGGAWGFRDQLQDSMCLKYADSDIMKNQIIKHSMHQFEEGDVLHWWHDETRRGVRTRFSDDLLWLVYAVCDYIEFTGDYELLKIQTPYLAGDLLDDGEDEHYDYYAISNKEESIYEHCVRAIERSLDFGSHGIPKIGSGDWNDGFNTVGNKGKGESVWLGFFLYDVLMKFIELCEYMGDNERKNRYKMKANELKIALNEKCWDGRWFNRAYCDDGVVIGSIRNKECKIDGISQSWAVISGASDEGKKNISMESLETYLVDRKLGIIKLLTPPFEEGEINPGYIKSYLPGTRENGGQYTHGAIWAIIAETMMNNGNRAMEYLKMISPLEHSKDKLLADIYKLEPYVIAADIYSADNLRGRGGWSWYTGSASWYYICYVKYILGLNISKGYLEISPCVPDYWNEYSIRYKYGSTIYNINVKMVDLEFKKRTFLNGSIVEDNKIKLNEEGTVNVVEVVVRKVVIKIFKKLVLSDFL